MYIDSHSLQYYYYYYYYYYYEVTTTTTTKLLPIIIITITIMILIILIIIADVHMWRPRGESYRGRCYVQCLNTYIYIYIITTHK